MVSVVKEEIKNSLSKKIFDYIYICFITIRQVFVNLYNMKSRELAVGGIVFIVILFMILVCISIISYIFIGLLTISNTIKELIS